MLRSFYRIIFFSCRQMNVTKKRKRFSPFSAKFTLGENEILFIASCPSIHASMHVLSKIIHRPWRVIENEFDIFSLNNHCKKVDDVCRCDDIIIIDISSSSEQSNCPQLRCIHIYFYHWTSFIITLFALEYRDK